MSDGVLTAEDAEFYLAGLKQSYEERMPFNRELGIKITELSLEQASIRVDMRTELVGNYQRHMLHGGAIAAIMDTTGGLVATAGLLKICIGHPKTKAGERFRRISTIDLRVDYLRPGKGEYFSAIGSILRIGSKIAVIRMELSNNEGDLIAAATGSYLVG